MNTAVLLISLVLFLSSTGAADKKKSTFNIPWPGFPWEKPPPGYFEDEYSDYELAEEEEFDYTEAPDIKPDHKPSSAFPVGIANAIHDFTFDLYTQMVGNKTDQNNIVISPLSVYTALSMLTLGLGGNSKAQAMTVLHAVDFTDIHKDMEELSDAIFESPRENATLTKANRIYIDRSIRLLKDFKRSMKEDYHVSAKKVNFVKAPGVNRRRINTFVQRHTAHKIKNLAPEGSITSDTRLFIVNAMHLKAFWKTPFSNTARGKFQVTPGEIISADMMSTIGQCSFEMDNELRSRVVRYQMKGSLSMIFIIPNTAGDFSTVEDGRGKERIRRALESLYASLGDYGWMPSCQIRMPKFQIDHSADDLVQCLQNMGMLDVFDASHADLSHMTPRHDNLYVSDMRHKAAIEVNEQGVEGVAATSIAITARMMPQLVNIDRPFVFTVRDDTTGATLFAGKVVRPKYGK